MPNIMTAPRVVEQPGTPSLWHLTRVYERADRVDKDALENRGVEVNAPLKPSMVRELDDRHAASGGEEHVERHTEPSHVVVVEAGVPWEDGAEDAEDGGEEDVSPSGVGDEIY
ncbi:hypothetical protein KEM55_008033 [Ascosphaera atra]|nr:hypothetical protein KEM55_008033 [Ascosphaera atra]